MNEYLPGLQGVPAAKSNISNLDGQTGILTYRGYRIQELAEQSNFEEIALLLLDGRLPTSAELDSFDVQLREESPGQVQHPRNDEVPAGHRSPHGYAADRGGQSRHVLSRR